MCTWQQGNLVFGRARKPRMLCVLCQTSGFAELSVSNSNGYTFFQYRLLFITNMLANLDTLIQSKLSVCLHMIYN